MSYLSMDVCKLEKKEAELCKEYDALKKQGLDINMTRGKPCKEQLDLSEPMLTAITTNADCYTDYGFDCRNYGLVDGLDYAKKMFSDIIGVPWNQIIVGGNSSLNLMYDAVARYMLYGVNGETPWVKQEKIKFLCPVPGYDRHFGICESLGIEMINVPLLADGPDMNLVEQLIKDPTVKGMWCVPKYSNPTGTTYSASVVRRIACMKPAAKDFRIFWDNAYAVHDLYDEGDHLLDIVKEVEMAGNPHIVYEFTSTSKISFPGSGISCIAASTRNLNYIRSIMTVQTIGHDKLNMLRHILFFKNADGIKEQMKKHAAILRPKFEAILDTFDASLAPCGIAKWTRPRGGYFISLDLTTGSAKRAWELAGACGVKLTNVGATFPYGKDPGDANLRIAPSYPPLDELKQAVEVLICCVKIAALEALEALEA